MECSLKAGSTFNVQFTERVEAAQYRKNLTYHSTGFHPKQLRKIHYPIQEIKRFREFVLDAKDKVKVKVKSHSALQVCRGPETTQAM